MRLAEDPRNTGFAWPERRAAGLRLLEPAQLAQFSRDGYCLLRRAVPRARIADLLAVIDPIEAHLRETVITLEDGRSFRYAADSLTFARSLVQQVPFVREFCRASLFRDLTHDLLGPDVRLYWDQAVYKKPGRGHVFPWHQDNGYTFTEPQDYLTCWLPLTPATRRNGCPWVVPGLHRRGTLLHESTALGLSIAGLADEVPGAQALEAEPGDVIVFSSLTPHRTGPNLSGEVRKAFIVQFIREGTVQIAGDGGRRPQNDPALNMWILRDGKAVVDSNEP